MTEFELPGLDDVAEDVTTMAVSKLVNDAIGELKGRSVSDKDQKLIDEWMKSIGGKI